MFSQVTKAWNKLKITLETLVSPAAYVVQLEIGCECGEAVFSRLASSTDIGAASSSSHHRRHTPYSCVVFEMKRRDRTHGRLETSCSRVVERLREIFELGVIILRLAALTPKQVCVQVDIWIQSKKKKKNNMDREWGSYKNISWV